MNKSYTTDKTDNRIDETNKVDRLYNIFLGASGVTTDSRNVPEGSLFFALKGDNFDGNRFALAALEAGASFAVVDDRTLLTILSESVSDAEEDHSSDSGECGQKGLPLRERLILTDDVLSTLQQLAAHHRRKLGIPIVALTGTNGKTTTKELITAVLSTEYNVVSTSGNLNNHIGVPLTILGMKQDTEVGVVEMGASAPGEIATLASIAAPDAALITNVGKAHLLGFGSFEGVKQTKGELYDYIKDNGGVILYNHDNIHLCQMVADRNLPETIPYGINYRGVEILSSSGDDPLLKIKLKEGEVISCNLVGSYNADNIMAAVAVGEYFGIPLKSAASAIEGYIPRNNRSQLIRENGNTIIIDAYNANPTSMRAALENFFSMELICKTLILGDMLELGKDSQSEHKAILELIAETKDIEQCFFVGAEFLKSYEATYPGKKNTELKNALFFKNSAELHDFLTKENLTGKSFLIKGSRGTRLEVVLPALS